MAQELHDEFGPQGYAFNTNEIAFCILRCSILQLRCRFDHANLWERYVSRQFKIG